MEKSRFEADIKNKSADEIKKWGKNISINNWLSLLSIALTLIVAGYFIYYLNLSDKT